MHNAVRHFGWKQKPMAGQHQWKLTLFTGNKQCFNIAENKNHPLSHAFCSYHLDKNISPLPAFPPGRSTSNC